MSDFAGTGSVVDAVAAGRRLVVATAFFAAGRAAGACATGCSTAASCGWASTDGTLLPRRRPELHERERRGHKTRRGQDDHSASPGHERCSSFPARRRARFCHRHHVLLGWRAGGHRANTMPGRKPVRSGDCRKTPAGRGRFRNRAANSDEMHAAFATPDCVHISSQRDRHHHVGSLRRVSGDLRQKSLTSVTAIRRRRKTGTYDGGCW